MQFLGLILLGGLVGALSGLFGVGGGIIVIPALVILLHFGQQMAQGTSLAMMVPTALIGAWRYFQAKPRQVDLLAAGLICVGSLLAARYAADLAVRLPQDLLKRLFAIIIVIAAVRMLPAAPLSRLGLDLGLLLAVFAISAGLRLLLR